MVSIGEVICALRKHNTFTQRTLSYVVNLSVARIGDIERGIRPVNAVELRTLSVAFDIPVSDMFRLSEVSTKRRLSKDVIRYYEAR